MAFPNDPGAEEWHGSAAAQPYSGEGATSPDTRQIEAWFPSLKPGEYEITSPADARYNCIAWAAGHTDAWWEPVRSAGYYWPDEAPWDDRIESLMRVFQLLHFEICDTGAPETGFMKIAIYARGGAFEHVARQATGDAWTSKLGPFQDIEHGKPDDLTGEDYGQVVLYMRRRGAFVEGSVAEPATSSSSLERTSDPLSVPAVPKEAPPPLDLSPAAEDQPRAAPSSPVGGNPALPSAPVSP